ncbi:MAG: hypothetical protein HC932_04130 [Thermales bacterium]|nr:hypothetical protein [Thermales bacterium]
MSSASPQINKESSISISGATTQANIYNTPSHIQSEDFGFYFWLHIIVIAIMYLSPFIFPISIILFGLFSYRLQLLIFKGCILTHAEFHSKDITQKPKNSFYAYYLAKLGIFPNTKNLSFFLNVIIPIIIFSVAIFWQLFLKNPTYFG